MQGTRQLAKKICRCPVTPVAVLLLVVGMLYLVIVQWWGSKRRAIRFARSRHK